MALSLSLHSDSTQPIDVEGIVPQAVLGLTEDAIARMPVRIGKRLIELAELFQITGDASDETIVWEGDLRSVVNLGAVLSKGSMKVDGSVGRDAGRGMAGGRLDILGNAGDGVGSDMTGGTLYVRGDVGHRAAASERGQRYGMKGGCLLVEGSSGDDLARGIRGGLVAVRGACGAGAMMDAVAGTVLVVGECGPRLAAGMRRGTLLTLGPKPRNLLPTFVEGRLSRPPFLSLLHKELAQLGFHMPHSWTEGAFRQYHGDMLSLGLGELFVAQHAE